MKAILVIDNPDSCAECPLMACDFKGYTVCVGNRERFVETDPFYNCPLRPLPQKLKIRIQREWITDYDRYEIGYNACLDKITGETE